MSLWTDLDSVARFNLVQEASAGGWLLVSTTIDYEAAESEPVFLAPDGALRYLDGRSAPLPVTVTAGTTAAVWTDPDPHGDGSMLGFAAAAPSRALIILFVAAAGVAVLIAARK